MKKYLCIIIVLVFSLSTTGCLLRESDFTSYNISKEADNFNVMRRTTVINLRDNTVLLQVTGMSSVKYDSDGDLNIISKLADGTYKKDMICGIRNNTWTAYVVEDLSGANVSPYTYEIEFQPESIPMYRWTNNNGLLSGEDK